MLIYYLLCVHGKHERVEDGFRELVFPLLSHMGSGDQTLVIKLDNKHLYPLSNFTAPVLYFLYINYNMAWKVSFLDMSFKDLDALYTWISSDLLDFGVFSAIIILRFLSFVYVSLWWVE